MTGFTAAADRTSSKKYDWPGNIRQLQNEVQRAVLMCDDNHIDAEDLSITQRHGEKPTIRT